MVEFTVRHAEITVHKKKVNGETVAKSAAISCTEQDTTQNALIEQIIPVIIKCFTTNYTPDGKKVKFCSTY